MKTPTFILILFTGFLFIQCQNQTSPETSQSSMLASLDQKKPDKTLTAEQVDKYKKGPCEMCRKEISQTDAKIMLFSKDKFIDLLNKTWLSCKCDNDNDHLAGFYIRISNCNLGTGNNCLYINAVFSSYLTCGNPIAKSNLYVDEEQCKSIPIKRNLVSIIPHLNSDFVFEVPQVSTFSNPTGFDQSDFQFCNKYSDSTPCTNLDTFENSFIGYHDLRQILSHDIDYIGVTGSRVSTGNMHVSDLYNDLKSGTNMDYFTFKITGFRNARSNEVKTRILNKHYVVPYNVTTEGVKDHDIPAEHFAVPCPPRWTPI